MFRKESLLSIVKQIWQVFRESVLGKDIPSEFLSPKIGDSVDNFISEIRCDFQNILDSRGGEES